MRNVQSDLPTKSIRVALAQMKIVDGDIQQNIDRAIRIMSRAPINEVDIIIFPEEYLTGYVPDLIASDKEKYSFEDNDERLQPLYDACKKYNVAIVIGAPTRKDDKLYISSIIISSEGEEKGRYNKIHLSSAEKELYTEGDQFTILNLKTWKLGLGICADASVDSHSKTLVQAGCNAYLASSLFSEQESQFVKYKIDAMFAEISKDNNIFVGMSNYAGETGKFKACGFTCFFDPNGDMMSQSGDTFQEVIMQNFCPEALKNNDRQLMDNVDSNAKIVTIDM